MANGSGFGRKARSRRVELGMSRSLVAEVVGVPVVQIGRWERGEDIPDSARVHALAEALDLGPDTARTWLRPATSPDTVSVEILGGPVLAPPHDGGVEGLETDPSSALSEEPPHPDDGVPTGNRNGKSRSNGHPVPYSNGESSPVAVAPATTGFTDSSVERALRRQTRRDERRLRRELTAAGRKAREDAAAETRQRIDAEMVVIRRGPLPMTPAPPPSTAPAPAGTANTGSVFPVPDTKLGSERVTYQGAGQMSLRFSRLTYPLRIVGTIAALLVLAGVLWWAVTSLGDGLAAVFDLFRAGEDSISVSGVIGLLTPG